MNFNKGFSNAWNHSFSKERVGVFFAFYFFTACLLLLAAYYFVSSAVGSLNDLPAFLAAPELLKEFFAQFVGQMILFALFFVALLVLGSNLLNAAVIKSAQFFAQGRKKSFLECVSLSVGRLPSLIALQLLCGFVSLVVSLFFSFLPENFFVDLIGFIASIVLSLSFFYAAYFILLLKKSVVDSILEGINLFSVQPVQVLIVFLFTMISLIGAVVVSLVPAAILAFAALLLFNASVFLSILFVLAAIAVLIAFFSFGELLAISFATSVFLELTTSDRKRRFS